MKHTHRRAIQIAQLSGFIAIALGTAVVVLGWLGGVESLQRPVPHGDTMKANTALSIAALGTSLFLRAGVETRWKRRLAVAAAAIGTAIGVLTLIEYAIGMNLGIDQLIAADPVGNPPGRPAPNTAVAFVVLGVGLLGIDRFRRAAVSSTVLGLLLGATGLTAYVAGLDSVYWLGKVTGMASHTAASVAVIAWGTLLARPEHEPVARLRWDSTGGTLTRAIPVLLGVAFVVVTWILRNSGGELIAPELVLLNNVILLTVLTGVIWRLARSLHRSELQRRQLLRKALEDKDRFIAVVSHELRGPAGALLGMADLLADMGETLSDDDQQELHESMARQGSDLIALIEDLLVASRGDLDTLAVAEVPVHLRAQVAQSVEALQTRPPYLESTAGPDVTVAGDPLRIRQIIRNLLTNAVRYGGETVRIETVLAPSWGSVRVMDNGPGIPAEAAARIFEPYGTADNVPKRSGSMGLGLSVARSLARVMGGDLTLDRRDGWTIFELSLPLLEVGATHEKEHAAAVV